MPLLVHDTEIEAVDTGSWIGWDATDSNYSGSSIGDASFTYNGVDIVLTRVDWHQSSEQVRVWCETAAQASELDDDAWFVLAWAEQDRDVVFQASQVAVQTRLRKTNAYPNGTVVEGIDSTAADPAKVRLLVYDDNPRPEWTETVWIL